MEWIRGKLDCHKKMFYGLEHIFELWLWDWVIYKYELWLGTSPIHSSVVLHNKDIICHFSSFLVNSGPFWLTSTLSITVLLVLLMAIKHGCHVVSCSYWQPRGGCLSYSWCSLKGCAMRPILFKASNNTSTENLLISYFKC